MRNHLKTISFADLDIPLPIDFTGNLLNVEIYCVFRRNKYLRGILSPLYHNLFSFPLSEETWYEQGRIEPLGKWVIVLLLFRCNSPPYCTQMTPVLYLHLSILPRVVLGISRSTCSHLSLPHDLPENPDEASPYA